VFSVAKIKDEFQVQINIPNRDTKSDAIQVEGNKEAVAKAVAEIRAQAATLQQRMPKEMTEAEIAEQKRKREDRVLRSYKTSIEIPREHHQ
jgi:hypothetical protein